MSSQLRISVDQSGEFSHAFSALEQKNLPFAAMQAANATAYEIRQVWAREALRVFDRPVPLTQKAMLYKKATKQSPVATVFLRDEAYKGTSPASYLLREVEGGQRAPKPFERSLRSKGLLPPGMFAVVGKGAPLDVYGNLKVGVYNKILSQLGAQRDSYANQSPASVKRRRSRKKAGGEYFAITQRRGGLFPGIYERFAFAAGTAVRPILMFVRSAVYRKRYDIFGLAERNWRKLMPFYFSRELAKAIETSKYRGKV